MGSGIKFTEKDIEDFVMYEVVDNSEDKAIGAVWYLKGVHSEPESLKYAMEKTVSSRIGKTLKDGKEFMDALPYASNSYVGVRKVDVV